MSQDYNDIDDVGDEVKVQNKRTRASSKRDKEIEDMRTVLSTYGGRAFIWRILSKCNVYKTSFTGNSMTFFNEGRRDVGIWLLDEIFATDKTMFSKMQLEAEERGERK